jgi:hypothetical protein
VYFFSRRLIGIRQFHPAVAAVSSYGAVNLEMDEKNNPENPVNPV